MFGGGNTHTCCPVMFASVNGLDGEEKLGRDMVEPVSGACASHVKGDPDNCSIALNSGICNRGAIGLPSGILLCGGLGMRL